MYNRPLKISTAEFGKRWGSFHNEKKIKLSISSVKKPSEFMNLMSAQLNFHPIEIIGESLIIPRVGVAYRGIH